MVCAVHDNIYVYLYQRRKRLRSNRCGFDIFVLGLLHSGIFNFFKLEYNKTNVCFWNAVGFVFCFEFNFGHS